MFQGINFPNPIVVGGIKFYYSNTNQAPSMVQDPTKNVWVCRTPAGCMWRTEDAVDVPASYSKTIWLKLVNTEWAQILGSHFWGEADPSRAVWGSSSPSGGILAPRRTQGTCTHALLGCQRYPWTNIRPPANVGVHRIVPRWGMHENRPEQRKRYTPTQQSRLDRKWAVWMIRVLWH